MKYCINCHAELRDVDDFCRQCGTKVIASETYTSDESIEIAKTLEKNYREWEAIKDEINNCERDLPRYKLPANRPRYSAFRFFWPFLIYSQIAAVVVGLIVLFIALGSSSSSMDYYDVLKSLMYFFAFIAEAVVLIIGGVHARNKRDALNSQQIESERSVLQKQHNIESRIIELKSKKSRLEMDLKKYDGLIPPKMRNQFSMKKVRGYLESNEAHDLNEALQMCQENK